MKRITALAAWFVIAAAPRALAGSGRDGEVRAVSVLPAAGSVEVVIDLQGAVELQDFTLASPARLVICLLYTSPSPRDLSTSRMPSSA